MLRYFCTGLYLFCFCCFCCLIWSVRSFFKSPTPTYKEVDLLKSKGSLIETERVIILKGFALLLYARILKYWTQMWWHWTTPIWRLWISHYVSICTKIVLHTRQHTIMNNSLDSYNICTWEHYWVPDKWSCLSMLLHSPAWSFLSMLYFQTHTTPPICTTHPFVPARVLCLPQLHCILMTNKGTLKMKSIKSRGWLAVN